MKKLPSDFSLEKYGLKIRLVDESDAEFITNLRSNPERTKHMVTLDDSIEKQKEWIQEYKKREEVGIDYYFIYSDSEGKPIGLNRMSHVDYHNKKCKGSSLITIDGLLFEVLKMTLIRGEIGFDLLGINTLYGEVHKGNIGAIKNAKLFGFEFKDIGTDFYHITLSKHDFYKSYEKRIIKIMLDEKK